MFTTTTRTGAAFDILTSISLRLAAERTNLWDLFVVLSVRNATNIEAHLPFVTFSDFGLQCDGMPGWSYQHLATRTGRRMLRFSSTKQATLKAGQTMTPCYLRFRVSARKGAFYIVDRTLVRDLSQLSDLRIPCHVGAGNFPLEPHTAIVTGSALLHLNDKLARGASPARKAGVRDSAADAASAG